MQYVGVPGKASMGPVAACVAGVRVIDIGPDFHPGHRGFRGVLWNGAYCTAIAR